MTVARSTGLMPRAAAYSLAQLPEYLTRDITVHPVTGEWLWTGRVDKDGYGRYGHRGVHRLVYAELVGPIPDGRELDHVRAWGCTSRACCSPWHLEPVTRRINTLRGGSFAAINFAKTECGTCGTPYDLINTYHYRNRRDCRACIRRRVREYQQRKRAGLVLARGTDSRADLGRAA